MTRIIDSDDPEVRADALAVLAAVNGARRDSGLPALVPPATADSATTMESLAERVAKLEEQTGERETE